VHSEYIREKNETALSIASQLRIILKWGNEDGVGDIPFAVPAALNQSDNSLSGPPRGMLSQPLIILSDTI
jgi:hypothetical protein